jgi:rhodanese-related sulfurtransferase
MLPRYRTYLGKEIIQMTTETLSKEAVKAAEYFENKLAFEYGPIGLKYAIQNKEPLTVIDLRTPELFEKSHIPGALNVSYEELEKSTEKVNRDTTAVVYCYGITCHLATKAALLLAKKGYKVKELFGGFDEWAAAELPIEGTQTKSSCGTSSCG